MRVIELSHEYPPFIFGGVGTFVRNLAYGLSRRGVEVTVVSGVPVRRLVSRPTSRRYREGPGVTVLRFPYPSIPPRHTTFQVFNYKNLQRIVKSIDPDVIHGHSGSAFPFLLSARSLAPAIVTFHTSPKMERNMSLYSSTRGGSFRDFWTYVVGYPLWLCTFRKELENSDKGVAVSNALMLELLGEMGSSYSEKITTVHNGVDIEALDRESADAGDDVAECDDKVLFAGRLFWRKGALHIVELACLLEKMGSKFKIVVHGEGPLYWRMKRTIDQLRLHNITMKGFTTRADLMRSMKSSRFVIVPSLYEACPMILLESMCLGKIPVMFSLPYSLELTENGRYGILGTSVRDMVNKLTTVRKQVDLTTFGQKISDFARKNYDIKNISLRYIDLYRKMCE